MNVLIKMSRLNSNYVNGVDSFVLNGILVKVIKTPFSFQGDKIIQGLFFWKSDLLQVGHLST